MFRPPPPFLLAARAGPYPHAPTSNTRTSTQAYAQPPCLPNQLSKVAGPILKGANNAINVTFTRPLTVPAPGVSIVQGTAYPIIGAMSTYEISAPANGPFCATKQVFPVHPVQYANGQTVVFF